MWTAARWRLRTRSEPTKRARCPACILSTCSALTSRLRASSRMEKVDHGVPASSTVPSSAHCRGSIQIAYPRFALLSRSLSSSHLPSTLTISITLVLSLPSLPEFSDSTPLFYSPVFCPISFRCFVLPRVPSFCSDLSRPALAISHVFSPCLPPDHPSFLRALSVCHKQFGASTAFKLIWCEGRQVAAITDDSGNLLNWGRPKGAQVPAYGASTARAQNWGVLANSPNGTMANRWQAACDQAVQNVKAGFKPTSLSGVAP